MNYRIEHYPDALATVTSIVWYTPIAYQEQVDLTAAIERHLDNGGVCEECEKHEDRINDLEESLQDIGNAEEREQAVKAFLYDVQIHMPSSLTDISFGEALKSLEGIAKILAEYQRYNR